MTKERSSNFELLRILAMLAIVAQHFMTQGGATSQEMGANTVFAMIVGRGARIAVNCYVIIGAWFLTEAAFKAERVLKIWFEVFFYSVTITLILFVFKLCPITAKSFLQSFLPIFGQPLWFAATYMIMLLFSPFLNCILACKKVFLERLLILMLIFVSVRATVYKYDCAYYASIVWFCFLYLVVGYLKKYPLKILNNKWLCFGGACVIYFVVVLGYILGTAFGNSAGYGKILGIIGSLCSQYLDDFKALPAFLCSIFIFFFFKNINIGSNKIINTIAASTFGVYIIHQVPAFYNYLWKNIWHSKEWLSSVYFPIYSVVVIVGTFLVALLIDKIRLRWLEPLLIKSKLYKFLCNKIDGLYKWE